MCYRAGVYVTVASGMIDSADNVFDLISLPHAAPSSSIEEAFSTHV